MKYVLKLCIDERYTFRYTPHSLYLRTGPCLSCDAKLVNLLVWAAVAAWNPLSSLG